MIVPAHERLQALRDVQDTVDQAKAFGMKDELIAKALKTDIHHLVQIEIALLVGKPLPLTQRLLSLASDLSYRLNIEGVLYASH